jgi:cell division protein FtsB
MVPVDYPVLQPVTQRNFKRQPVQSRFKKQASLQQNLLSLGIIAALLFGIAQSLRTVISDTYNLSILLQSKAAVQNYYQATQQENRLLSHKVKIYSSPSGIEELARNYLNMVGKDELLVRFQ